MTAFSKLLAGCGAVLALGIAAPAAAQYYPGYGGGYQGYGSYQGYGGYPGNGGGYGYGLNQQAIVNQCTAAVQQRLGGYGGGRVLGISSISPRDDGGIAVRGVASSGRYGYGYGVRAPADLSWRCRTNGRGYIREVTVFAGNAGYGNTTPYNGDFSEFGYRRY